METILVGLKNEKAKQLLTDLAALDLIEIQEMPVAESTGKLSELRHKMTEKMTEEQIDAQLQTLRGEWQRSI